MGASESKLEFKEDIFRLAGEDNIPLESSWWLRVSFLVIRVGFALPASTLILRTSWHSITLMKRSENDSGGTTAS